MLERRRAYRPCEVDECPEVATHCARGHMLAIEYCDKHTAHARALKFQCEELAK
jgi:hypothetical protein